jgi:uncharacterized protein (TIGR00266 family)
MQIELLARPAATVARVHLAEGESVTCETGAMIAMSSRLQVETSARERSGSGGVLRGLKRMFAGESLFLNHFTAMAPDQHVILGPTLTGDIIHHQLDGTLIVQGTSWLASSHHVEIDMTWQGIGKALFSGEGFFWVKCHGSGDVLLNSFGAIYEVEVDGEYLVDTGHIVAFEDSLSFQLTKAASSWLSSLLGGEGLACKFTGRGKLYCQSHNAPAFGRLIGPLLKPR